MTATASKTKLSPDTVRMRTLVIGLMREHAESGEPIGMADASTVASLADALERDPSQWFAAGMQLMQAGMISHHHYEVLMGRCTYDPRTDA